MLYVITLLFNTSKKSQRHRPCHKIFTDKARTVAFSQHSPSMRVQLFQILQTCTLSERKVNRRSMQRASQRERMLYPKLENIGEFAPAHNRARTSFSTSRTSSTYRVKITISPPSEKRYTHISDLRPLQAIFTK